MVEKEASMRWNRSLTAMTAVAACALVLSCKAKAAKDVSAQEPKSRPDKAVITYFEGEAKVDGEAAELGMEVKRGAKVVTGKNSACEITFRERNVIRLSQETIAVFDIDASTKDVALERGIVSQVLKNLVKLGDADAFSVRTPSAVLGVRGTTFCVNAEDNWTYVCACNGTLRVKDLEGGNETLISSPHHQAFKFVKKDGKTSVVPAELKYHDDESVQALASKINYVIDWTKIDG
jgi:ferric-dicitrate binding protein FerR (iron transport regulator)